MSMRVQHGAVALLGVAVGLLFLREPGFGDDLTYWSFAFHLHEEGVAAWSVHSFHQLRWPVWGLSWLWQAVTGPGLIAYYGVPLVYLALGAALTFSLGKRLTASLFAAWACALAFLFHPLIDSVCYRPMPDLSEGVCGAAAVLAWWNLMHAQSQMRRWLFAAATGAAVFILEANRVTGVFIVPVLALCTFLFFPGRFAWLVLAGVIAALLYAGECLVYRQLFGDWLHDLTANSRNAGRKGTEAINPLALPIRFLDVFVTDRLGLIYSAFALVGGWVAWLRVGVLGRVVVLWFGVLYLEYACAVQSLVPLRPLLRDAERFLSSLAIPGALLAVLGLRQILGFATQVRVPRIAMTAGAIVLLLGLTERSFFSLGFVPELRRHLAKVADGTLVFTHEGMRDIVFLVDAWTGRRVRFIAPEKILERSPELEARAVEAQEFWYARKLVWVSARKRLERGGAAPELASYFATPERDWKLGDVLVIGHAPDLVFYRRRTPMM
ncbi:MAG TPA: hypothetical protein VG095_00920, partial [Chthoniobacterales bacterium]|nr:hypothetical protein [Chthoniobacterales bacterium]